MVADSGDRRAEAVVLDGSREGVDERPGRAGEDLGAAPGAHSRAAVLGHPDDQVGNAVAIDVAGAGCAEAEMLVGDGAGDQAQDRAGAAGVNTYRTGVRERRVIRRRADD